MFTPGNIGALVSEIVDVFEKMVPDIARIPGISDRKLTEIETAIDDLKNAASMMMLTPHPRQTTMAPHHTAGLSPDTIERIEKDATVILSALAALPLPPPVALGFRIASMLLPVLIAAAKLVVNQAGTA